MNNQGQYKSKIFAFGNTREESVQLLENLKLQEERFVQVVSVGEEIKKLCNNEDLEKLKALIDRNTPLIPYLRIFIEEAFEQMILYRFEEIIDYFFQNGFDLSDTQHKFLITMVQTSRFLVSDPPVEIFQLLLVNGGDLEETEPEKYRTPLHLSCRYGIAEYIKLLIEHNVDVNSVDSKGKTPLYYLKKTMENKKNLNEVYQLMINKGAKLTWKDELPQF